MKRIFTLSALFFVLGLQAAWGQIPQTVSYQGVLTDVSGTAVPDGNYNVTFKLYDAATGGTELWSEEQSVDVSNGLFNVILGSVTSLTLSFDRPYWLGLTVGQNSELTPRIELTASPYSLNARSLADSAVTGSKIARGQVVRSINAIKDDVTLAAGNNISITQNGDTLAIAATGGNGGGNTLDQAYDQGGAGAGRRIIADAGAVDIAGADGLTVNGKVGIGTTVPGEKLDVKGNVKIGVDTQIFGLGVDQGSKITTGRAGMVIQIDSDSNQTDAFNVQRGDGTSLLYVISNGFVGIGTTDPREKLVVNGNVRIGVDTQILALDVDQGSKITTGRSGMVIQIDSDANQIDAFDVQRGDSTSLLYVSSDGAVGIGTTNPRGDLHLSSDGDTKLRFTNGLGNDVAIVYNTDNNALEFRLGGTGTETKVVINDGGNVGIGTTNPANILTVVQGSDTDPIADAWTTYSSRRWKTNVKQIEGALEKVQRLRGVAFDWKADGKHDIGLIAEEVGEVIPEVVAYEENGKDAKSVDYPRLVAVLIEAMKEQQKAIEKQQATIDALVERITELEGNYNLTSR